MDHISLAPLINLFGQFLLAVLSVLIPMLGAKLLSLVGIKLKDAQWAVFDRTAMSYARQIWAEADANLATKSIMVSSPLVQKFAEAAIDEIPDILNKLGLTPDTAAAAMQQYIVAHLGAMQATAVSVPAPASAK